MARSLSQAEKAKYMHSSVPRLHVPRLAYDTADFVDRDRALQGCTDRGSEGGALDDGFVTLHVIRRGAQDNECGLPHVRGLRSRR